jgi:hypothetical protein
LRRASGGASSARIESILHAEGGGGGGGGGGGRKLSFAEQAQVRAA